ncbi:copper-binding protein [Actibacterium mucosum KCTC 23349]|uniref:Copper-binding protein n=1 Tax=Actibacterium mucosum KCTC 23349 TaxID=1454373 RepID=A0A037ZKI3_9RHOB|nr:copper chaperone PCu(A)C [Actibacterium mucosum]KAJ56154.1 copper-binding protein [Actibacterium mucosum KCTC 23349]
MLKSTVFAAAAAILSTMPAFADGIMVKDAYARSASPAARTGAIFMVLDNHTHADDRLIAATSEAAARVELHTHTDDGNGVMRMHEVEGGFAIPAHGEHVLARGGDHVMLMGLTAPLVHGETVDVTLTFEKAGEMTVSVPVDLERNDAHAGHGGHGDHGGGHKAKGHGKHNH